MKKKTLFAIIALSIALIMFIVLGIQSVNKTNEMVNLTLGLNN
jgi:hypothetical protein